MSKLDDILDHTVYKDGPGPHGAGGDWRHWKGGKDTSLKRQIKDLMFELVGDGEMHVSHVCPQDNIACREFQARSKFRNAVWLRINEL